MITNNTRVYGSNSEGTVNSNAAVLTVNPILYYQAADGKHHNWHNFQLYCDQRYPGNTLCVEPFGVTGISKAAGSGTGDHQ
jgi:hypothetical protein